VRWRLQTQAIIVYNQNQHSWRTEMTNYGGVAGEQLRSFIERVPSSCLRPTEGKFMPSGI